MEDDLVRDRRVLRLDTEGRRTGRTVTAVVGFVERADGSLAIAAGTRADWGENLLSQPRCRVTLGDDTFVAIARPLSGAEGAAAIRDLILRYGTPAERLGSGPVFEVRRAEDEASEDSRRSR
jgi:deazaflavin-dependent oxidoreductase (nitroreductase family)